MIGGTYNPTNWYWIVGEERDRVYSSARAAYVPVGDAAYAAWLAEGNRTTNILSEAELRDVFAQQYPAGWPAPPVRIIRSLAFRQRLAPERQQQLAVAAVQAAVAGNGAPLAFQLNQAAGTITDLDDQQTIDGVAATLAAGLITEAEAATLVADGRPEER